MAKTFVIVKLASYIHINNFIIVVFAPADSIHVVCRFFFGYERQSIWIYILMISFLLAVAFHCMSGNAFMALGAGNIGWHRCRVVNRDNRMVSFEIVVVHFMHCDLEIEQGSLFSVFQKCQNDYFVLFVNKHFLFVNKHFLFVTRETCEMPCDSQGILESIWSGFESPLGTQNLC